MGENPREVVPVALYGTVLLMAASRTTFSRRLWRGCTARTRSSASAVGRDVKGILSVALYAIAIPLAFVDTWLSHALYVLVALIWIVPDRRIERAHGS